MTISCNMCRKNLTRFHIYLEFKTMDRDLNEYNVHLCKECNMMLVDYIEASGRHNE